MCEEKISHLLYVISEDLDDVIMMMARKYADKFDCRFNVV
jgi:hypothetical protein